MTCCCRSNRRRIHEKVGSIIEKDWPAIVAGQPELLAYHFGLAGNPAFAVRYWVLGGQRARARSANVEAVGQFQRALECLKSLPESAERARTELELQLSLGLCFIAVQGYSADDTRQSFEHARSLSSRLGEQRKEIQAIFGLWGHYWMKARHDQAVDLGETLLAKGEALHDPVALIVGHRALGSTLFTKGDFVQARVHLGASASSRSAANRRGITFILCGGPSHRRSANACLGSMDAGLSGASAS